jgi:hypothetical protein
MRDEVDKLNDPCAAPEKSLRQGGSAEGVSAASEGGAFIMRFAHDLSVRGGDEACQDFPDTDQVAFKRFPVTALRQVPFSQP